MFEQLCLLTLFISPLFFHSIRDYNLNFMIVNMHTLNVVLLLGDTTSNSLQFLWFRISYSIIWMSAFIIFQCIILAYVSIWWAYPFLDLWSPYASLWYYSLAFIHLPCYDTLTLIVNAKHYLLSKWFPQSYQCVR